MHVTAAVYNYNGSEILASYNNSNIYLFDVNQPPGNFKHQYQGHLNDATIKGVSFFGPKSEFVVSGSDGGNIYFWDRETEAIVQCMLGDEGVVGFASCIFLYRINKFHIKGKLFGAASSSSLHMQQRFGFGCEGVGAVVRD